MTDTREPVQTCRIALRDLHVLADIGVHHHEIGRPQPLVLHVCLSVVPPREDRAENVFDYAQIKAIAEALSRERIVLIETFARRVAERCLANDLVVGAAVTVEKPRGVPGAMASATVVIDKDSVDLARRDMPSRSGMPDFSQKGLG